MQHINDVMASFHWQPWYDMMQVQDWRWCWWGCWTEKIINTPAALHALSAFTVQADTNSRYTQNHLTAGNNSEQIISVISQNVTEIVRKLNFTFCTTWCKPTVLTCYNPTTCICPTWLIIILNFTLAKILWCHLVTLPFQSEKLWSIIKVNTEQINTLLLQF